MSHNTGLVDGLHRYLRISYGEMDDNNAATYMMQGSLRADASKCVRPANILRHKIQVITLLYIFVRCKILGESVLTF